MACLNCKTLIELMRREIDQLQLKKNRLLKVNATLQAAANQVEHNNNHWKDKYQEEAKKYQELQKQFLETTQEIPLVNQETLIQSRIWGTQERTPQIKKQQSSKKRSSLRSVEQMDKLMLSLAKKWKNNGLPIYRRDIPLNYQTGQLIVHLR